MRILLIEDDEDVLIATRTLLEKWGCVVDARLDLGTDILPCDLIVSDYDLSGSESGAECIARARNVLQAEIPAIVITGHSRQQVVDALDNRRIPVLTKPVRPADLRAVLMAERLRARDQARLEKPASTAKAAAADLVSTSSTRSRAET